MSVTHDANSSMQVVTTGGSWTHTPTGTPRGALIRIIQTGTAGDRVSAASYGGVTLNRIFFEPLSSTESGAVYIYWADDVPAGAQTTTVTSTGSGVRDAISSTYTAAAATELDISPVAAAASGANPTLSVAVTADRAALIYYALWSGAGVVTTNVINGTHEANLAFGAQIGQWARMTTTGPASIGYTLADEEWAHGAIAIAEVQESGGTGAAAALRLGWQRGIGLVGGLRLGR